MITIDFARTLHPTEADSAHDFDHLLRVMPLAKKIAQVEGANAEVVRVARCCTSRHSNGRSSIADDRIQSSIHCTQSAIPADRFSNPIDDEL